MLRVACLVPHPVASPSSRIRVAQYGPILRERGIDLQLLPFFDDAAFSRLYEATPARRVADTVLGFHRRVKQIREAGSADAVLVHREVAPFASDPLLRLLRDGPPLLFDLDDAVFLPAHGGSRWVHAFRRPRSETVALARAARLSLAGNRYLGDFIREAGGKPVELPTTVDTEYFRPPVRNANESTFRVSWIGTHSTQGYLAMVAPALRALARDVPLEVTVVSNRPVTELEGLPIRGVRWSLEGEQAYFQGADVGLYPLPDNPWTRGKCGGKAVQYLACGVPVVASPVGVLREMVVDGVTGFTARSEADWLRALRSLASDRARAERLGQAGRRLMEERYSLKRGAEILADAIHEVVGRRS